MSVVQPTSVSGVADLLRTTTGSVLVRGAGTKQDWAGRVSEPDLVLDTTRLTGLLTYNPADLTASVRAGTTLADLQAELSGNHQWLALDPPSAERGATVGGLVAAGDSGPSRLRYGGLRDLVIGVTIVLADGTIARSGGHVIKNVAGYDLAKLLYGSLGSLAVVAEVVVRLHPRPPVARTVAGPADVGQASVAALALAASPLEPAAVEWVSDRGSGGSGQLFVRVDGSESSTTHAAARIQDLVAEHGITSRTLDQEAADRAWQRHSATVLGGDDGVATLRIASLPSQLPTIATDAFRLADRTQLEVELVSSAAVGLHTVHLRGGTGQGQARTIMALRERARAGGASVLLCTRPTGVDEVVDALGPAPSSVALLRRIKSQFDPDGRLAPGRFHPWY